MMNGIVSRVGGRQRTHEYRHGRDVPLFTADWRDAVFVHFEVGPSILQPFVPFALDTFNGSAYVSLVAFAQEDLRPTIGGALSAWLVSPLARHEFLNLRAYVRVGHERGIYFIAEWIPNRLAALIGPRAYGLPYRLGRLRYRCDPRRGQVHGRVIARGGALHYVADYCGRFELVQAGSLDEFLLERYVAFTHRHGVCRRFQVDHAPWPQQRIDLRLLDRSILALGGAWQEHAHFVGANLSPGVSDVSISAPRAVACCGGAHAA